MRRTAAWLEDARGRSIVDVATRLGLEVDRRGRSIAPCPACGRKIRNASTAGERRGAIGLPSADRWHCFPCELGGDAIDLVAASVGGARFRDLGEARRREVREWFESTFGSSPSSLTPRAVPNRATPAPAPKSCPDPEALVIFVDRLVPVTEDAEVSTYLRSRRIDPGKVTGADLARALPVARSTARWARGPSGLWTITGHRLIVPLRNARGICRSVLSRRITSEGEGPKSLAPAGYSRTGLVMACGFARQLLETGVRPDWWPADGPPLRVVVVEGETDFLVAACEASDANEYAPAVFGITSGSWTTEIASRIPDGSHVVVATDNDKAGEKYARTIVDSFEGRAVELLRWRPRTAA